MVDMFGVEGLFGRHTQRCSQARSALRHDHIVIHGLGQTKISDYDHTLAGDQVLSGLMSRWIMFPRVRT